MSRFREEIGVIAPGVWLLAVVLFVVMQICLWFVFPQDPEMPIWARTMLNFVLPAIVFIYTLLVGYVFRDAKRRGMRHIMWTLLSIFIPNAIGFILYFIFREPIVESCAQCGTAINSNFAYCPKCGAARGQACRQCHSLVQPGWVHCAKCGATI